MNTDQWNSILSWARNNGFTLPGEEEPYPAEDNGQVHDALPFGYLSPHFRAAEFTCNHCGKAAPNGVPTQLLDVLEEVRAHFGKPVVIMSGYRCPTHNRNVGGATNSQHMLGTAADIQVKDVAPFKVFDYMNFTHPGGLGKYATFTHIDVRPYKARW